MMSKCSKLSETAGSASNIISETREFPNSVFPLRVICQAEEKSLIESYMYMYLQCRRVIRSNCWMEQYAMDTAGS